MLNLLNKKQTNTSYNNNIITNQDNNNNNNNSQSNNQVMLASPSWKEWNNSIYSYNKNYSKLLVHKDKLVNYLFRSYFNLTKKIFQLKRKRFNHKRFSSNRIFLSNAEIKHTNTNVNITLFIFNKNKNFMKYKLKRLQNKWFGKPQYEWDNLKRKFVKTYVFNVMKFKSLLYNQIKVFFNYIVTNVIVKMNILFNLSKYQNLDSNTKNLLLISIKKSAIEQEKINNNIRNLFMLYFNKRKKLVKKYASWFLNKKRKIRYLKKYLINDDLKRVTRNIYLSLILENSKNSLNILKQSKYFSILERKNFRIYKYLCNYQDLIFNKNKFANWFLIYNNFGIINLISKIYNKKVEFNIVNLKSIHLNNDIYSEAIALKLKNRNTKLLRVLKKALFKVKLIRLFDLCNIDKKTFGYINSKRDVLNSLKYKLVSGARFETSGRLTRRLIASKSVFKFRYVGSLKNIYSSFVGLPSVMLRGYLKSNIQQTVINSKTRNGAFGLKGWTSSY
jgi:hypothetical protein